MKFPRRQLLHLAAGAAALPVMSYIAWAQTYPTRPVRLIVSVAAGGSSDIVARLMSQWLSDRLGHQFIIDNRPGAGNNIGAEAAINAPPDGYTLYLATAANAINATLYQKLSFNFIRDITPVAGIVRVPLVMEVNTSVPVRSVPDFIAYAKANPNKINFASAGSGTTIHMSGELFKTMTGVNMVHVSYRGAGPALTDLIGGQVQVMFDNMPSSIGFIRDGKLRPLAVTTATRWEGLPELPTVAEFVPGFEASAWFGVSAPRKTPIEIVEKLNKEINSILADPKKKDRLADLGGAVIPGSPADFGKLIIEETEKWGKVVKAAGVKAD
jgi:tripartite-type tricarboxylate transporter receptor subunit TctC